MQLSLISKGNPHETKRKGNSRQKVLIQGAEIIIQNAKSFDDMKKEFKKYGIQYELKYNKNKQLQGAILKQGKTCVAVSKILQGGHFALVQKFNKLPPIPPKTTKKVTNDVLFEILEKSRNEEHLKQELSKNGYKLSKTGNNFTILNKNNENIKPSSIHKNFTTNNLKKKWRKLEKNQDITINNAEQRQTNLQNASLTM